MMVDATILRGLSVLLLEDDALINMSTAGMLEELGCRVHPFLNLREANNAIENWTPGFALLDINIGGDRSFGFAALLGERGVPVAFLTGYDASILKENGIKNPYCQKPCNLEDLVNTITSALKFMH